jgi:DnaJ-domain-containing protein 1
MSDILHVRVLRDGPRAWNEWRRANAGVVPLLDDLKISISERQFGPAQGGPIDLSLAELRRAELDQATLTDANLAGAVLIEADLSDARLEGADLQGANLSDANLAYATLGDARLDGANLCGADLHLARGLTQGQVDTALGDLRTALPEGLEKPRAWLGQDRSEPGQLVVRAGRWADVDENGDPFVVLGVEPGAAIEEIRSAWLELVKELHPDIAAGVGSASERLKIVNRAYQRLKVLERQARRQGAQPAGNRSWAIFATFFLLPAVVGAAVGAWIYFTIPDPDREVAPDEGVTEVGKSATGEGSLAPPPPPIPAGPISAQEPSARDAVAPGEAVTEVGESVTDGATQAPPPPPIPAGPATVDEPAAGADKRLR